MALTFYLYPVVLSSSLPCFFYLRSMPLRLNYPHEYRRAGVTFTRASHEHDFFRFGQSKKKMKNGECEEDDFGRKKSKVQRRLWH